MFCIECGKENNNEANFCIYCGKKLDKSNLFEKEEKLDLKKLIEEAQEDKKDDDKLIEKLNNSLNKEVEEFGEYHREIINNEVRSYRTRYKRDVDFVKWLKPDYKTYILVFSFIICFISFFVGIVISSNDNISKMNNIIRIVAFIIFGITFILISLLIITQSRKDCSYDAILSLKFGTATKGIISEKILIEKKKEIRYYIIFKYYSKDKLYETCQRVQENYYKNHIKGEIIDIKLSGTGVIEESSSLTDTLFKRMTKKSVASKLFSKR